MILPWWSLAGFAVLGAMTPWWLIEMEGFGSGEDEDENDNENEDDEDEDFLHNEENESSQPTPVGGAPLAENAEGDNHLSADDDRIPSSQKLSKTTSHASEGIHFPPLKRMSSPIGMKDNIGPGGSDKLSNGLGQSRSGLGVGGTSFH